MKIVAITLQQANQYIEKNHRHHKRVQGWKFGCGLEENGILIGVATIGRPVSRMLDDGKTLEITRVCTNGEANASTMLMGALCRAAFSLGYEKIITYTLVSEPGTSLKAGGFQIEANIVGQTWNRPNRKRTDKHPTTDKIRWARYAKTPKPPEAKPPEAI